MSERIYYTAGEIEVIEVAPYESVNVRSTLLLRLVTRDEVIAARQDANDEAQSAAAVAELEDIASNKARSATVSKWHVSASAMPQCRRSEMLSGNL
jgi:hypothetical protein